MQIAKALRQLVKKTRPTITPSPLKVMKDNKKVEKIIKKELITPLEEARLAMEEIVIPQKITIDLLPRNKSIRKLQHELISHYQLRGKSIGIEPNRRLRLYP